MLDFLFWLVVALVLWFAWDTYRYKKAQRALENANNERMESIDEQEGQGPVGSVS